MIQLAVILLSCCIALWLIWVRLGHILNVLSHLAIELQFLRSISERKDTRTMPLSNVYKNGLYDK